ncbi:MAG: 2-hydroxyacyl-CoA dehydratase family protein [Chloroflexota bacterium]|nr:2-hydroxyacyl-CoA dehydratase family protein [Chloroflexota bacterium]
MTTEQKKRAINRLDSRKVMRPMVDKMYAEGVQAALEGKPVAWCMVNWWEGDPILRAMGVTPVYPENYGTVCAAEGTAQEYLGISEAEGFPSHLCGYARNCFGYTAKMKELGQVPPGAPIGGMPQPTLMMSSGGMCDARYKWFQALRRYWDVPVWVLEFPHPGPDETFMEGTIENSLKYMTAELGEFVRFLEHLLGKKMDWDVLEAMLDNQEKVFGVWWETNELRKAIPGPMHARDFWTIMVPCLYEAAEKDSLEGYQQVFQEVKARVDGAVGAVEPERYRLMFAELPPWHSLGFFDKLAERGWNFVTESMGYHPPPPLELKGSSDPLERIARWTLWFLVYPLSHAKRMGYPMVSGAQPYLNWAQEYKLDGLLLHPLLTCRTATFWLTHAMNVLRDLVAVPSLVVEGDIVDLTVFDEGRALDQAAAFEDTMEHYRKVRKERGLAW